MCKYEEGSDPDPCNVKVTECLASEHRLIPAACKEDLVMNQPDWPAFVFIILTH